MTTPISDLGLIPVPSTVGKRADPEARLAGIWMITVLALKAVVRIKWVPGGKAPRPCLACHIPPGTVVASAFHTLPCLPVLVHVLSHP